MIKITLRDCQRRLLFVEDKKIARFLGDCLCKDVLLCECDVLGITTIKIDDNHIEKDDMALLKDLFKFKDYEIAFD